KRSRREEDDEEDWAAPVSRKVEGTGAAKTGMLMVGISMFIQLGTFALLAVFMLVGWMGGFIPFGVMVIPGILGLASWVTGLVGFGLSIGGPARSRGLAIAATAVAAV